MSKADIGEILASSMEPGTPAWERLYRVMTGEGFCTITEADLGHATVDAFGAIGGSYSVLRAGRAC